MKYPLRPHAALAAALALLLAAPARADQAVAASGPYTLTQSLVDADAAYWEWASGRALTPDERGRLAAVDVARFRRDPAGAVHALGGEQGILPLFRARSAPDQDKLRRLVLNALPQTQINHLTPDEARQVQQIVAGVPASVAPAGAPRQAARPAAPVAPAADTAARPVSPTDARLPLQSGPYTMTQGMVDNDLVVTQWIAARPLTAAERQQVTAINVAQFRREPAWQVAALRREMTYPKALARMDPVRLADWRKSSLVANTFHPDAHLTPDETRTMLGIYTRDNPVVCADKATGTVITARDVDAWAAADRLMSAQGGVPTVPRATLVRFARDPALKGPGRINAANMERNWAVFRRCWPHEPAGDRRSIMADMTGRVRRGAAKGQGPATAAYVAVGLAATEYGDYPYALDPKFAALKPRLLRQLALNTLLLTTHNTSAIMQQTIQENGRLMRNGQRGQAGLDPLPGDENPVPYNLLP